MSDSVQDLAAPLLRGDTRAIARMISLVENGSHEARELIMKSRAALPSGRETPHIIGVTGSPGAGKSTLVDQLAMLFNRQGRKVAIIAVDPSSPFSGGAILGDRIRMNNASETSGIFVRSMATRGALGGLARSTFDALQVLELAGFDLILLETVGVGQAEVDIVRSADTCLVVLVPGMGDSVQAFKAGILEIADVFVINKSDRDGSDLLAKDLRLLISVGNYEQGSWTPPIVKTIATSGEGCQDLVRLAGEHRAWLASSEPGRARRKALIGETIRIIASEILIEHYLAGREAQITALAEQVLDRRMDARQAAQQLIGKL